uniref:Uncharacterized protein n=1 Tax=Panagrolaimus davidi TaxID=227884 RepID=A0A914PH07_9BILA
MIDGETDTNYYDQVWISVQPPTLTIPILNENSEGSSDNDLPLPPSTLNTIPLTTPVYLKNHHNHYDDLFGTHTTVTTTVTKLVDPPKKKSKGIGAIFCLLLAAAIVSALVLLLVFGWHEKFSAGDIGQSGENGTEIGQGNLTMDLFFTDMVNINKSTRTTSSLAKTIPTDSWISITPSTTPSITHSVTPTTTSTPTKKTLFLVFGWHEKFSAGDN